ncbi:MAG: TetR/AcrR family transcriptional regulator C-terminal domain-containing protein [Clostridia bacterium]|nr:TetR/AcrR family transcriptional regulator C-terminal domain-containing protein [Clostridia bacterium]
MNVKNNKRRRESIEKIEKAFIGLLQEKEIHEITVSDICKIADLNRSTFYANYIDIYDLADKIKEHLESEFQDLFKGKSQNGSGFNDAITLFRHVSENQLFYKTYFKLGYDSKHEVLIYDIKQAEKYFNNKHIKYHIEFFRTGFNAIIKMWLADGCRESPEEMAEIITSEYQGR